jgi:hypothetical protein
MTNRHSGEPKLTKWTIISFLLGTLLGSGSIWQWEHAKVEAQKQELDRVTAITELRQKEIDQYDKIINLSNEYVTATAQYSKNPSSEIGIKILQLTSRLDVMKNAFIALEDNLAHLEGRQPRKINLNLMPPQPPTGISGTMH